MSNMHAWDDRWADVDSTEDPESFVRYLDTARRLARAAIQRDPRQFYAYLNPQEGDRILDIGAGTGDLTRPLVQFVGPSGRVVGVDYSQTMVDEARRRAADEGSPAEFMQGDIRALGFPDESFDRVQVRLVLQHVPGPREALTEAIRVLKPGGLLAVADQDLETLIVDSEDRALTRKIASALADGAPNGWIGRQLYGLFKKAGLQEVRVLPSTVVLPNFQALDHACNVQAILGKLEEWGLTTLEEAGTWVQDQEQRSEEGRFFAGFNTFTVTGRKPGAQ